MSSSLIGGLATLAGVILSAALWVWRKSERKAGSLERENELLRKTLRVVEDVRQEDAKRHRVVEDILRARAGMVHKDLEELVKKVESEHDSPAVRESVGDMLDRVLGVQRAKPDNTNPSTNGVSAKPTPDPKG